MNILAEEKKLLRRKVRELKAAFTPQMAGEASERLLRKLEAHPRFQAAQTVLLFHALPDEPDTKALLQRWVGRKTLLLPVVAGDDLEIRKYTGEADLAIGAYGILEPSKSTEISDISPDLAIVPGVAFDRVGHRLGRGKGYYDKLFQNTPYASTYKIGYAFRFQVFENIPSEAHDVQMDEVMSDTP